MNATTAIILDTRRATKNDNYPLKLRVNFQRKRKYYGINIHLSEDEWKKVNGEKPRGDYKTIRFKTDDILKEADDIIKEMDYFSFEGFEKRYIKKSTVANIESAFQRTIDKLTKQGRISTAISYNCAKNSLNKFNSQLKFSDINPVLLQEYESWMREEGNSKTTVGFYLRSLRTILNEALNDGIIKPGQYPFGKNKYQIPTGKNIKKSLTISEVQRIMDYKTIPGTTEDKSRDFWILSYLCNGANIKDICRWKYKNLKRDKITFFRSKTERISRNPSVIVVIRSDKVNEIIKKWGNEDEDNDNFIFPILNGNMTPIEERNAIKQFIKTINKYMNRIGNDLGIETKLTTYVARHTFSTILKRGGVPISFISESLGHTDLKTTENYLGSFEDEQKREFANLLIPKGK